MSDERRARQESFAASSKTLWEIRPAHSRKYAQFSDEWAKACDEAFARAMMAAGYQPCFGTLIYNSSGSSR